METVKFLTVSIFLNISDKNMFQVQKICIFYMNFHKTVQKFTFYM